MVGGAEPTHLAAKHSNTLTHSNQIFETYTPVHIAAVKQADAARKVGRTRLSCRNKIIAGIWAEQGTKENESGNFPTPAPAKESELASKPASMKKAKS